MGFLRAWSHLRTLANSYAKLPNFPAFDGPPRPGIGGCARLISLFELPEHNRGSSIFWHRQPSLPFPPCPPKAPFPPLLTVLECPRFHKSLPAFPPPPHFALMVEVSLTNAFYVAFKQRKPDVRLYSPSSKSRSLVFSVLNSNGGGGGDMCR